MTEELIRRAVLFKLDLAEKILGRLPAEHASRLRQLGNAVYESIGEHLKAADTTVKDTQGKVNRVPIE